MRAVVFHRHGGPEVLEETRLPEPPIGAGEVLVRVKSVALNHLDVFVRRGWPGLKLPLPHVLGSDVSGVIERAGAEVTGLDPGTPVIVQPGISCMRCEACLSGRDNACRSYGIVGENRSGGYAEFLSVPHHNVVLKPANLSFDEAAAAPLVLMTAWEMLVRRAALQPGEWVLVHAAGSGVGSAGVQVAKLFGAKVIATAGTDDKLEKARSLGADFGINYEKSDFVTEARKIAGREGVDVVFDHVGARTWDGSVRVLKNGGRLVTCGATSGHEVRVDLKHLFWRRLSLLGSTMGSKGDLIRIVGLLAEGKLRAVVDRHVPLAAAAEAHVLLEERATFGKIVLRP